MIYFVAPIFLSYAAYVFIAEQLNPLKTSREVRIRRQARRGRQFALALLPMAYGVAFSLHHFSS